MMRLVHRTMVAVAMLAVLLAGCSAGPVGDTLPSAMGGLPQGNPARLTDNRQYPAVHDMPAARPTTPLSEEDQVKLEKDLQAVRDRQSAAASAAAAADAVPAPAANPVPKPAPKTATKKQTDAKAPGAKTSGASTNP